MNMAAPISSVVSSPMPSNVPDLVVEVDAGAQWKRALVDLFNRDRHTHAVTLVWNRRATLERLRDDLRRFHRRVDKKLWGSRCERYPTDKRSRAVFVVEDIGHHPHVHSLWRCPPGKLIEFNKLFPATRGGLWNELIPSGEYKMDLVTYGARNDEFVGYLLKKQHMNSDPREIIWSDEFLPDR